MAARLAWLAGEWRVFGEEGRAEEGLEGGQKGAPDELREEERSGMLLPKPWSSQTLSGPGASGSCGPGNLRPVLSPPLFRGVWQEDEALTGSAHYFC